MKPALQRLRDGYSAKARELGDQLLSLQEQADSVRELLAEREEENRNAEGQVTAGRVVCGVCGGGGLEGLLGGRQVPPSCAGVRRLRQDFCVRDASAWAVVCMRRLLGRAYASCLIGSKHQSAVRQTAAASSALPCPLPCLAAAFNDVHPSTRLRLLPGPAITSVSTVLFCRCTSWMPSTRPPRRHWSRTLPRQTRR